MRIDAILQHTSRQLAGLLKTVTDLKALNAIVSKHLDASFVNHCRVANYRRRELILVTDSTVWSTRIRYIIPELIEKLQREPCFCELQRISCSVDPAMSHLWQVVKNPSPKAEMKLSHSTRSLFQQVAQSIRSPALQKTLLRLARED